jgi:fructuronate reductase
VSRLGPTTPGIPRRPDAVGIVHLGIGAFHRAHQAVYTDEADREGRWGICGVTQRSRAVVDQLAPQDGLYGVLELAPEGVSAHLVGAVREVVAALDEPHRVLDRIADPGVGVVTLTVTEKGYRRAADGHLDLRDAGVQADLATPDAPVTAIGQLARGLQRRAGGPPLTVLCCDNLIDNGSVVAALVEDFCAALPPAEGTPLRDWVAASVRFPSSMVDRIVPATTERHRTQAADLLGAWDEALVVAEPFRQWVIEDDFAGPVPGWERAGALLTDDVAPYEAMKLRLLNATHSLLAYAGGLAGYETIAAAVQDEQLAAAASSLMTEDVLPTLVPPDGVDLAEYCQPRPRPPDRAGRDGRLGEAADAAAGDVARSPPGRRDAALGRAHPRGVDGLRGRGGGRRRAAVAAGRPAGGPVAGGCFRTRAGSGGADARGG